MELWKGRFEKEIDPITNDFNQSIRVDKRMYKQDILGSIAHSKMLGEQNIIPKDDSKKIQEELKKILEDIENGTLLIDENAEDIHTFIEGELTKRIGTAGKKLHTARSRNDQVALDIRMYLKDEIKNIIEYIKSLIVVIDKISNENKETVMPGYTHLQRAQPVTFGYYMQSYKQMLIRDIKRLEVTFEEVNVCPLGSCALAGTTYNINRNLVALELGFVDNEGNPKITQNTLDAVSDRDFVIDLEENIAVIMMHLSRLSEEISLWSSWEFKFIELDDSFSTGSSIMPQKKNPDITELIRGKTGRTYGNLIQGLTMMKGLPLAYNKDMQEDKEAVFDSIDNVKACLKTITPMLDTMQVLKENMEKAAKKGFINATDVADYLTKKGMPFREAYKLTGELVNYSIKNEKTLDELTIEEYKKFNNLFEEDIYKEISLINCVKKRGLI